MKQARLQPVRVLFLDHVPRMSGAEQSLFDLVVGLASGPVEPVVVLPGDGPLAADLRAHGVLVRKVPMSDRLLRTSRASLARSPLVALFRVVAFLSAGWRVFRLIREVRPRIVHTNTLKSHLIAAIPCKLARVPLVWHMRDILPSGWLRRAIVAWARLATVVIVPSRAVAEPFRGSRRIQRKLRLIPNGIRCADFQDARRDRSLRQAMGATAQDTLVGIVGRIAPWKGQDVFIRAAAMVARRHPRAKFAIVGAAVFGDDDSYERALHRMAYELGLEDRVVFLGWQPAPEAMAALDVVVHASQEPEPFGRAIVEAMAAGKPIVAADGGAVREIVPPSAGFIVPPGRPELLADALDRLLEDRKLRKRMGEAGTAIADSFFPVERTVQSVATLYRSLGVHAARARRFERKPARRRPTTRKRVWASKTKHASRPSQPMAWPQQGQTPNPLARPSDARAVPAREGRQRPPRRRRLDATPADVAAARQEDLRGRRLDEEIDRAFDTDFEDDFEVRLDSRPEPKPLPVSGGQVAATATLPVSQPFSSPLIAPVPAPVPLAAPRELFYPKPLYDAAKRALDIFVSLAVLIVGLPVWATIAVLIKVESRGPVFHRGTVYGKGCKPFTYFKFRSMRVDASDRAHRNFIERYVRENGGHEIDGKTIYKLVDDNRVTTIGRVIRKLSLDEVPQLINVLRGEMSIVGPRPPLDYEYELYNANHKVRMCVLPGITGLQQVDMRHAPFEDKLRLDNEYVRRRSILLDVAIMLRTIPAAIRGR